MRRDDPAQRRDFARGIGRHLPVQLPQPLRILGQVAENLRERAGCTRHRAQHRSRRIIALPRPQLLQRGERRIKAFSRRRVCESGNTGYGHHELIEYRAGTCGIGRKQIGRNGHIANLRQRNEFVL